MSKRKIKSIIVHHSVSRWGDGAVIKHWHQDKKPQGNGWKHPGYHVVICNGFPNYYTFRHGVLNRAADGRVDRIWTESQSTNGCKYANMNALHVCMIGDFDSYEPTENQMKKLIDLLTFWCKKYKLDPQKDIYGHGEMQKKIGKEGYSKTCPGKNVDMDVIRNLVFAERHWF